MSKNSLSQDEQLFIHLITSFSSTAWIGLGKIKNPVTDKIERDLQQASYAIDMLDMIARRMENSLSKEEKRLLSSTLGDLKLNYVDELKRSEKETTEKVKEEEKPKEKEKKKKNSNKKERKSPRKKNETGEKKDS